MTYQALLLRYGTLNHTTCLLLATFQMKKGTKRLKSDQIKFSKAKKAWYVNESPSSKNNNSITLISPQKASWWMRALTGKLKFTNRFLYYTMINSSASKSKKASKLLTSENTKFFFIINPTPTHFHHKLKSKFNMMHEIPLLLYQS